MSLGQSDRELRLARGLWDCLLAAGADISDYAYETVTAEGREAGFKQWVRMRTVAEMAGETLEAVNGLREAYEEI